MTESRLFWSLPYALRRWFFKKQNGQVYKNLQVLRIVNPEKLSAPTFKPFLENKCIFVHIPKAAGISVGSSLFGRHTGNHTSIAEYQMAFSQKEFESFYKFTFVRNPWDRLLSAYLFLKKGGRNDGDKKWAAENISHFNNFQDFVLNWVTPENVLSGIHFMPQYYFVTLPGNKKIQVDFVGKFENLGPDFKIVKNKLGIGGSLVFENKTEDKSSDYRNFYNRETQKVVARVYKEDIALFDYQF